MHTKETDAEDKTGIRFNYGKMKSVAEGVKVVNKRGLDMLYDPRLNKGTAFTAEERERLGIRGLVPPVASNIEKQAARLLQQIRNEPDDVRRYLYMAALQDRNETLFYQILTQNMKELAPVVYTPTVGIACLQFGNFFRRPRGMYLNIEDKGHLGSILHNWPEEDVKVIVVTDGSRILGLGDLGCNGMGIPIGKLSLYIAGAGIKPKHTLPIMIDVGTNNATLLEDPTYLGLRSRRVTGSRYFEFIDEFLWAVKQRWPKALVQFEDFSSEVAYPILTNVRKRQLCFNDDIQGTGAVVLAGIYAALAQQGLSHKALVNQRIVCVGAGSAGLGVCYSLLNGMRAEGVSTEQATANFWVLDDKGLITNHRDPQSLMLGQAQFARNDYDIANGTALEDVVRNVKPTILLGLAGVGPLFSRNTLEMMGKFNERPIIFPLSNPTSRAECTAEEAYLATEGRAIFSSGSPFEPVTLPNGELRTPSQGNNMYIFPGVGLAACVAETKRISLSMFSAAAKALANSLTAEEKEAGLIYPAVRNIRQVSKNVAVEVIKVAQEQHLAMAKPPKHIYSVDVDASIAEWVDEFMWTPTYHQYVYNHQPRD